MSTERDKKLLEKLRGMKRRLHRSASTRRSITAIDHGHGYFSLSIPSNQDYYKNTNIMNLLKSLEDLIDHSRDVIGLLERNNKSLAADEFTQTVDYAEHELDQLHSPVEPERYPSITGSLYGLSLERAGGVVMYCKDDDILLEIGAQINYDLEATYDETGDHPAQVVPIDGQTYEDFKASAARGELLRIETGLDEPIFIIQPWSTQ